MAENKEKIGKEKLTIYLPEELIWAMREVAVARRISHGNTAAIEAAVSAWVASAKGPHAELHALLDQALSSDPAFAVLIRKQFEKQIEKDSRSMPTAKTQKLR